MRTSPSPPQLADRVLDVETPEHVAIGYPLADLGSRFAALVLDTLLLLAVLASIWLLPAWIASWFGAVPPTLAGWTLGVVILLSFAIAWGYFIAFEALRDGQTPGKRRLGIRVVHEGGYPLTLRGAAIRNLVRFLDVQPIPACLVGGVTMLLHPRTQRLGDLAAGTLVVRDAGAAVLPEEAAPPGRAAGPPRLDAAEWRTLSAFVERAGALEPAVRQRIAGPLAERLERHHAWDRSREGAAAYLAALHTDEAARREGAGGGAMGASAAARALVRRQRGVWEEFRELLGRARRDGLHRLSDGEISRFGALYREVAADLARARTYGGSPPLLRSLERLVAGGHNLLYRPPRHSLRQAAGWVARGFPALVRRRWRPIAVAALVFYLPAVLAFTAIRRDPALAREVLPAEMISRAEAGRERDAEGRGYIEIPEIAMPAMATGIIANNVQVVFVSFAGGVLAGVGTALVLLFNGVFLGGVFALFANQGLTLYLLTFVLPHGVIELTAIAIAGGAGLWLGSALLLPGRRTRREVLAERAREAVGLIGGVVVLLLVAGLIEGFISPAPIARPLKLGIAAVFAALLFAYLLFPGRDPDAPQR